MVFLAILLPLAAASADSPFNLKVKHKNDIIVMENGDRNTGEIKKMEFGILYLKSDRVADTMKLDWERVVSVESIARYEFETASKDIYIGIPAKPSEGAVPGELKIILDGGAEVQLKVSDIISVYEMGRSWVSRLNISLDAGISFTSANKRAQSSFNFSASFRRPKHSASLTASSLFSDEEGVTEKTERHEVVVTLERYLRRKWDYIGILSFLRDNQQDLDLRSIAGGGVRRMFYETNRTRVFGLAGAVYTNEKYSDLADSDRNNAEALAGLGISTYRFRGSSLNTAVFVYPSISDPGRVRVDSIFNWKWDIVSDLYWKINFTDNYDNRPPPGGIHNNLSINSTVGWSF